MTHKTTFSNAVLANALTPRVGEPTEKVIPSGAVVSIEQQESSDGRTFQYERIDPDGSCPGEAFSGGWCTPAVLVQRPVNSDGSIGGPTQVFVNHGNLGSHTMYESADGRLIDKQITFEAFVDQSGNEQSELFVQWELAKGKPQLKIFRDAPGDATTWRQK